VRRCAELIGFDVLEYAPFCHPNFRYVEVPDRNFECHSVQPNSVDFVFSFGLFCHLSCDAQRAYLKSIHRVLKPNGSAVICFANFQRHPGLKSHNLQRCKNVRLEEPKGPDTDTVWFYNDLEETRNMVAEAGFVDFVDELPAFRDTLASFRKPV
jgi:predicted SAM-dependent methyltransferase